MSKVFLKIVPETFEVESRDMRELRAVKKLEYDIHVLAKQKIDKSLPYELTNELFSLRRLDVMSKKSKCKLIYIIKKMIQYIKWKRGVLKHGYKINPDVISAHDLLSLSIGYKLKKKIEKKKSCKLVYDSHELTTERAGFKQRPLIYRLIVERSEKKYIKKADAVMVVCESIAEYNQQKYKLKEKPYVVRNIPEMQPIDKSYNHFREKLNIGVDKIILLYQGGFSKGRGIENIIKALGILDERFVFVMLGYSEKAYKEIYFEIAKQNGVENRIYYMPAVSLDVLQEYSNSADIGLSLVENYCLSYYYCLPNKIFEYMNANLPILCSDFPEMSKIVNNYCIGECVEYDNIKQIAEKILNMTEKNNYIRYKQNMAKAQLELNWVSEEKILINMYKDL